MTTDPDPDELDPEGTALRRALVEHHDRQQRKHGHPALIAAMQNTNRPEPPDGTTGDPDNDPKEHHA
ncbi:hypothetical protein FSW04_20135 [Baekduia soli]|uniref:Uncharacterized protein n=1 Tax=Baekduia soli TaxID=496014 RepID=A0A5B8U9J0_9ACTN|nr:hypothetical protein [Baekduia soli]QEC49657.1 hypothetical protein FSW04_20135 [Baekduia soli]